jgi:hypothetical protein
MSRQQVPTEFAQALHLLLTTELDEFFRHWTFCPLQQFGQEAGKQQDP